MNKGGVSVGIVGLPQKTEPMKTINGSFSGYQSPYVAMHVGNMVEGMPLGEDRPVGQGVVSFHEVVQPGVGFASHVRQGMAVGPSLFRQRGFVIDHQAQWGWYIACPTQILPTTSDH